MSLSMFDTPIYRFEEETADADGKAIIKPFSVNVTYSTPRNLNDPGKALIGIFSKITKGMNPEKTNILDFGAGKLRNTLWLLQKGFNVWAVEFPELIGRLPDAKAKWALAESYPNFHKVCPSDFSKLKVKFDIILLINEINVMPIPAERFLLLSLCREKIKKKGMLLWHQWRGIATSPDKYSEDNEFIDGYLMGAGPHHTFYVEYDRDATHELLYSTGFSFNKEMNLHKIPGNSCYSYIFNPSHEVLISKAVDVGRMRRVGRKPMKIIPPVERLTVLDLYIKELETISVGKEAHRYHLLASRIFFEIFRGQLKEPVIEREINEGRGRIDAVCGNRNKEGIFKNLKELRGVSCPQIMLECKNYNYALKSREYEQLSGRLVPGRGILGFLLCRDKKDEKEVLKQCRDRIKDHRKHIIVLDDTDLVKLAKLKINEEDDEAINDFIESKIGELVD